VSGAMGLLRSGCLFLSINCLPPRHRQVLEKDGILNAIALAFHVGSIEYSVSELGIPGLRHFLYKSRVQVQVTLPIFEDPYHDIVERRRCFTLSV
jgi:hypothetical protein